MTCPKVGRLLGDAPRSIEYWVQRLESHGLAGLQERERSGRPRRLGDRQLAIVDRVLRQSPQDVGLPTNLWGSKTLSAWIEQQYGLEPGVRQCQRLFRQPGFRLRELCLALASADPELKRADKKLLRLAADASVDLWTLDEVHFQQHGWRCRSLLPGVRRGCPCRRVPLLELAERELEARPTMRNYLSRRV